ncbi:LysM peptidoglycan-binding domain-containing protein [Streptomyces laurentii]|uniref:LysM peptidoglycan-binding domain-containing protein n=1 Tax=Streptomyces laurentii TaxID=39478 RepID=UPI003686B72A
MRGSRTPRRALFTPLTRGIALAGGIAVALPLIGATAAAAATPQAPTLATKTVAVEKAAVTAAPVRYSVVAGDSLSAIAAKYAVQGGWQKIYQDNKVAIGADPMHIRPGLTLNVAPAVAKAATTAVKTTATAVKTVAYTNNLDGWIRESLDIMSRNGIPGTYNGIYRNVMRESSGNPLAINNWDINAINGIPSKGLLQVIDPTFRAYHVAGTALDSYDPVANITAACNYAADRYGSIDNVFGAY